MNSLSILWVIGESINIIDNIVNDYMEDLKKKYKMIKRL